MDFKPNSTRRARYVLGRIFQDMDREMERKKGKPPRVEGPRNEFLKKYKEEGYQKAKQALDSKYGKEIYKDKTLKGWIEEDER